MAPTAHWDNSQGGPPHRERERDNDVTNSEFHMGTAWIGLIGKRKAEEGSRKPQSRNCHKVGFLIPTVNRWKVRYRKNRSEKRWSGEINKNWVAVLCGALFGCLKSVFNLNGHVIQIKISFSSSNQLVSSHVNVIQLRKIIAGADSEAVRATLSLLCLCWLFITYFFFILSLKKSHDWTNRRRVASSYCVMRLIWLVKVFVHELMILSYFKLL